MSEQNKGHSTMGLPRVSGKRRWSGEEEGAEVVPAKVICTSPPHALCAEDVLHHSALTHANASTPALECEMTSTPVGSDSEVSTSDILAEENNDSATSFDTTDTNSVQVETTNAFIDSEDESVDEERDDFIDDEEDKDSGFIDCNSIDNSSDDEVESSSGRAPVSSSETSVISSSSSFLQSSQCLTFVSSSCSPNTTTTTTAACTSLQLSLSRVLPHASTAVSESSETSFLSQSLPPPSSTSETSPIPSSFSDTDTTTPTPVSEDSMDTSYTSTQVASTLTSTITTMTTATSVTCSSEDRVPIVSMVSDGSVTTVTAAQTETVVTSAYQGTLTTPAYDPHSYPYQPESYPSRPPTPSWGSCNFYDGSQPNTNKYMEISPSKSSANQSIQCDENGKSYLELGSASPYTQTYTNDCGNYTTSPSNYPSQSYNQTCTSPTNSSTYGQPASYFNSRQSYSPNPYNVYPASDGYGNFEGENGCGYGYGANGYSGARGTLPPRGPPRCMSPYCDPTRGGARPNCYHQQRLSVLNMSMYKLNRFRQFPEPSLHRSVLICNTLRHIERELEAEGVSVASLLAHSHAHTANPHLQGAAPNPGVQTCPEPMPSSPAPSPIPNEGPLPPMHAPLVGSPLAAPVSLPPSTPSTPPPPPVSLYSTASPTVTYPTSPQYLPTDHPVTFDGREAAHLRQYQSLTTSNSHEDSGVQGPSSETDTEAEIVDPSPPPSTRPPVLPSEDRTDAINWCSVLSLSSQTDLDSMNNNEYGDWGGESSSDMDYTRTDDGPPWKLPSLSADDVLKSFPEASKRLETNEDLDSIINVLVGS